MFHGILTRLFLHTQQNGALQPYGSQTSGPDQLTQSTDSDDLTLIQSTFSYHAFLGGDTCKPENWERTWGVAVSVILVIYLCLILVRICDQYLIPSLEVLSKKWGLSEDVAGVTLLAFGGSFPELAIHTIATVEGSEIGVGTVIGSAVFNVTFGLTVIAFLTPHPVLLFAGPLIRDSSVYILCLSLILIFFNWNARVRMWQAALMLVMYVLFVTTLILRYQQATGTGVFSPELVSPRGEEEEEKDKSSTTKEPESSPIGSAVVVVADGNGTPASVGNGSHSRQGSRRGSTTHGNNKSHDSGDEDGTQEREGLLARPNAGALSSSHSSDRLPSAGASSPPLHPGNPHYGLHDYSDEPNPGVMRRVYYAINRPTDAFNRWCIPNCTLPGQHKYYRRAFGLSLFFVLIMSFTLMCIVQYMGCVSGIDHAVTGLLVLGVAASLPDIISVGVSARRGLGVMAVSGLVGSNVFDIMVGLGFPWLLHMGLKGQDYVPLTSGKVYVGAILAVVSVIVFGLSILLNGMKLQRDVAWLPLLMYAIYVILVVQKVADPPEDAPTPQTF